MKPFELIFECEVNFVEHQRDFIVVIVVPNVQLIESLPIHASKHNINCKQINSLWIAIDN